jgi:hypothetical protein
VERRATKRRRRLSAGEVYEAEGTSQPFIYRLESCITGGLFCVDKKNISVFLEDKSILINFSSVFSLFFLRSKVSYGQTKIGC